MRVFLLLPVVALSACAWISPDVNSHHVALVKPQAALNCDPVGHTTSKTLSKIVVVNRNLEKQRNEAIILAKNQAATMGGDTIVAKTALENGEQTFAVYRCKAPLE